MPRKITPRDEDLSKRTKIKEKLLKTYDKIRQGFADQRPRANDSIDYWDAYNCVLGHKQVYNGTSQIYLPLIRVAVEARVTRFINQLFPQSDRNVEAITMDGEIPHHMIALVEHYIRDRKLRENLVRPLLRAGDVEGQYSIYCDWSTRERRVTSKVSDPVKVAGLEIKELGEIESIEHTTVVDPGPAFEVLSDADLLVWPPTAVDIEDAFEKGGGVALIRRWSEGQIKDAVDEGDITEEAAERLKAGMTRSTGDNSRVDTAKNNADAAGIKLEGGRKHLLLYEVWLKLKVDGTMRLCRARFGGDDLILSAKLNPFWCDRCPIISASLTKAPDLFKGMSKIKAGILDMQILANDIANEMADLGHFTVFPIILTDPNKNPNYASMVMDLMAVWEADPNSTKILQLPDTAQQSLAKLAQLKQGIFEALSVSPAMLPQQTGQKTGGKRSQAEVALEQQVELLSTSDSCEVVEEQILTPMVGRILDYDHQFRDDVILVRSFGELGIRMMMQEIPPQQQGRRWHLVWSGVAAARNAAQVQQMIATMNVVKAIPKEMYPNHTMDVSPVLTQLFESVFGPRLAPLVFKPLRDQLTLDPKIENNLLQQGFDVPVQVQDNDQQHIQVHAQLAQQDPTGAVRVHIQKHMVQMQAKNAVAMANAAGGKPPGPPQAGQGGGPRPGAQPQPMRPMRGPPGMIAPDQLPRAGALVPPRRA